MLIEIEGIDLSGKSTVGAAIADWLKCPLILLNAAMDHVRRAIP